MHVSDLILWYATVMEIDFRLGMDIPAQLNHRSMILASSFAAALQSNPTGDVDLYPIFESCTTLQEDVDKYYWTMGSPIPTVRRGEMVYSIGQRFAQLQHLINPQRLGRAWEIRVKSLKWDNLLARDIDIEHYYRRESTEMHHVLYLFGSLMTKLNFWKSVNYETIFTNRSTMESYHVLSLYKSWEELSTVDAVEGPGGDIYIRISTYHDGQFSVSPLTTFVMYRQGYSFLNLPSVNISEATEESVESRIAEHKGRIDHLTHGLQGNGISAHDAAPSSSLLTSTSAGSPETKEESNAMDVQLTHLEEVVDLLPRGLQGNGASKHAAAPNLPGGHIEMEVCHNTGPRYRGIS